VTIPTYYSKDTALDLSRFEQQGLSLEQVIELHTSTIYQVSAVGFMPGFAFLSDVVPTLQMPRHETPRLSVPKGSVGIADRKTAVYPDQSPGGWNIIGRSPLQMFNSKVSVEHLNEASFFNVGDQVKFEAISRQDFLDLGGCLND
jgi:KipI family sensor histidine kinase inhibitor